MSESKYSYNSPGISASDAGNTVDPNKNATASTPALIIGSSPQGPAFIPTSFSRLADFETTFGFPYILGSKFSSTGRVTNYAPFAVFEWLANQRSVTFIRVLGVGNGKKRISFGSNSGDVANSGFTVGEKQPSESSGILSSNPYANENGVLGRTYFLGCFMSESIGSTFFNEAGLQGTGSINGIGINTSVPIVRGILMAPSGVVLRLSASAVGQDSSKPSSTEIGSDLTSKGTTVGDVKLFDENSGVQLQQFVILLNGHKGNHRAYPNVITASLDMQSDLYITKVLNTTASLIQQAGHYLAAHWDIHPSIATLTGTSVVNFGAGCLSDSSRVFSTERSVFLLTSSLSRDTGSTSTPNYENFRDRFSHASSPWIISQKIQGKHVNLFKLHLLDDGEQLRKYKIIISNITPERNDLEYKFGTFDLTIRNFDDLDEDKTPLERYNNLSLNPSAERYISKVIGDRHSYFDFDRTEGNQKIVIEGNYPLLSDYVRVEVSDEVFNEKIPSYAVPFGFRGLPHIVTSGSNVMAPLGGSDATALTNSNFLKNLVIPPIPLTKNIAFFNNGSQKASQKRRWGIKFDHVINLKNQNSSYQKNFSSFLSYFPNHSTTNVNFSVSDNEGTPDTSTLGIIDADRFCNNLFTLENIKITTSSTGYAAEDDWAYATYIRGGVISTDEDAKTRRVSLKDLNDQISRNFLSFQTSLCGGFDGTNIFDINEFNLTNEAAIADMDDQSRGKTEGSTVACYLKALEIINDTTAVDFNLFAIPGIRIPIITNEACDVAESRMDCLYLMDIEQIDDNDNQIQISKREAYSNTFVPNLRKTVDNFEARAVNTSYAAAYYPDVEIKVNETIYGVNSVVVPPSVAALGCFSINDLLRQPWSSPAGNTGGAADNVLSVVSKLKKVDFDSLYEKNINFFVASNSSISGQQTGIVIGGQKTLGRSKTALSSLSRINVRRMLLEVRRQVRIIGLRLLFEPNKESIISRFTSEVESVLSSIQSSFGLEKYKVEVDTSTTTQNDIDNQTLRGKIYIKPTKSIDYVSIDYVISNNLQSET